MKKWLVILFSSVIFFINLAQAELHLVVDKGLNKALPIAVLNFRNPQNLPTSKRQNIASIIQQDLIHSGHFNVITNKENWTLPVSWQKVKYKHWLNKNCDYLLMGSVKQNTSNTDTVSFALLNLVLAKNQQNPVLVSDSFNVAKSKLRAVAHRISDIVYQQLTGIKGAFNTRIAYVLIKRPPNAIPIYELMVADADGFNPRALVKSNAPLMSPAWSPNGQKIAYVSLANDTAAIYVVNVATGKQKLISDFPGINGAPAWTPDGKELAIVLSKSGHPKIYFYKLSTGALTQVTFGKAIDTEPSFAPNGKAIIFTSNRDGSPQVFQLNLMTRKITRITFQGQYNARPSYIEDGEGIVLLHKNQLGFNIAIKNLRSGNLRILTDGAYNNGPSAAPNGQAIIYADNASISGALKVVTSNGQESYKIPAPKGTVLEPAWSPFLS